MYDALLALQQRPHHRARLDSCLTTIPNQDLCIRPMYTRPNWTPDCLSHSLSRKIILAMRFSRGAQIASTIVRPRFRGDVFFITTNHRIHIRWPHCEGMAYISCDLGPDWKANTGQCLPQSTPSWLLTATAYGVHMEYFRPLDLGCCSATCNCLEYAYVGFTSIEA